MIVKLAKTAGFCMGVRRAVDMVLDMARRKGTGPVYTYGDLIHNPQTVELLKRRGIVPVKTIDEIKHHYELLKIRYQQAKQQLHHLAQ